MSEGSIDVDFDLSVDEGSTGAVTVGGACAVCVCVCVCGGW